VLVVALELELELELEVEEELLSLLVLGAAGEVALLLDRLSVL